jgi:hypothetical protein
MAYNYLNIDTVASLDLQPKTNDGFYFPVANNHTGFSFDGTHYTNGVQDIGPVYASWYTEFANSPNPYRGSTAAFPTYGLVLLSLASLVILDQSVPVTQASELPMWMQFLLADGFALSDNYNGSLQGFSPQGLTYADGVISIIFSPDAGNQLGLFSLVSVEKLSSPPDSTTYVGTIPGGTNNAYTGYSFTIKGFVNAGNNGTFNCLGSSSTTLTLANTSGVIEGYSPASSLGEAAINPTPAQSHMILTINFALDQVYVDVAL